MRVAIYEVVFGIGIHCIEVRGGYASIRCALIKLGVGEFGRSGGATARTTARAREVVVLLYVYWHIAA